MNTLKTSLSDEALVKQNEIIRDFFATDHVSEMVESMHYMVESFLFSSDLENVTSEMRVHIVNQLRVATMLTKLDTTCKCVV
ncbi:hypothetical protein [Dyadobacter sp. Leaf189]|uniref:hypothetical protein n=1 Tax=Dyadobacter sp. Leaf189 TaxID=1736295 RepID=UPI00070092A3|nr:hypothetical protein [Dyadobacter sp. Leaf189]KQS23791.1 hypothetical protein ASG33_24525 [Dyadobacter sp. Leaf189]